MGERPPDLKPWPIIGSRHLLDLRVFSIRADQKVSPRTGQTMDFYVLDCVDWVNIVALTRENQIILVEQFRHGSNQVELEIPGGMMDAEDRSPLATAHRELLEETGFSGSRAEIIGSIRPNPAIMSNRCYTVLVHDCEPVAKVALDDGEDLKTSLVALDAIPGLITSGKIQHSLVLVALYHFHFWQLNHRGGSEFRL